MDSDTRTRHVLPDGSIVQRLQFVQSGETDGNTLVGLAVPFDSPTRIDSWAEGTFDEQFAPGSFKRSLGLRRPVLQFDHGTHPLLGSIPLGSFDRIEETKRGLEVEAPIFDNWLTEPVRDAIRGGAIDGMSIRFRALKIDITDPEARHDDDSGVELRTIREAELIELGPVVFPAYPTTEVDMRHFDLSSQIDRRRLAEALLAGVVPVGDGSDEPSGPGTVPEEAGTPATTADQDSLHSVRSPHPSIQKLKEFERKWISRS